MLRRRTANAMQDVECLRDEVSRAKKVSRKKKAQSFKFSLDRLSLPLPKRLRPTCVFRFFFDDYDLNRCHVIAM
jgi:hypothetical protein